MTNDTESDTARDALEGGENATAQTAGDGGTATEATAPDTGAAETEAAGEGETQPADGSSEGRSTGERLAWLVQVAALVVLCLLALVATFRVYFAASTAIGVWISEDFVSVFQVAFNLLVLVASVYGISVLVRRLS